MADIVTYILGKDTVPSEIHLGAGERKSFFLLALPGTGVCGQDLTIFLDGEGASLDLKCAYALSSDDRLSLRVDVRHTSGGCESRQLYKGLVAGRSRAVFDGLIYVAEGAQKTKAFQESHTIQLSAEAFSEARPQLEIYADDVECSHGATSGFLSTDELFYMQSRGIPEDEARRFQMMAFLAAALPEGYDAAEILEAL